MRKKMKPNKKQRREVYLRAAGHIDSSMNVEFCCNSVIREYAYIMGIPYMDTRYLECFKELMLFRPKHIKLDGSWWNDDNWRKDNKERVLALLLCAEMCR